MSSTRLPGKVLAQLGDQTVLASVVARCRAAREIDEVIIVTSTGSEDDALLAACRDLDVRCIRGSREDVLDRYLVAALQLGLADFARITADCPLIDPEVIDETLRRYAGSRADYVFIEGYPRGLGDVEVIAVPALARAAQETLPDQTYYREHVMTYLVDHPESFRIDIGRAPIELRRPELRLTVDESADLETVRAVCAAFAPRIDFSTAEIIRFLDAHPEVVAINRQIAQKGRPSK